jgi:hypothetical protein
VVVDVVVVGRTVVVVLDDVVVGFTVVLVVELVEEVELVDDELLELGATDVDVVLVLVLEVDGVDVDDELLELGATVVDVVLVLVLVLVLVVDDVLDEELLELGATVVEVVVVVVLVVVGGGSVEVSVHRMPDGTSAGTTENVTATDQYLSSVEPAATSSVQATPIR